MKYLSALLTIFILLGCSVSQDKRIVSKKTFEKRRYFKGYHFKGLKKINPERTLVSSSLRTEPVTRNKNIETVEFKSVALKDFVQIKKGYKRSPQQEINKPSSAVVKFPLDSKSDIFPIEKKQYSIHPKSKTVENEFVQDPQSRVEDEIKRKTDIGTILLFTSLSLYPISVIASAIFLPIGLFFSVLILAAIIAAFIFFLKAKRLSSTISEENQSESFKKKYKLLKYIVLAMKANFILYALGILVAVAALAALLMTMELLAIPLIILGVFFAIGSVISYVFALGLSAFLALNNFDDD